MHLFIYGFAINFLRKSFIDFTRQRPIDISMEEMNFIGTVSQFFMLFHVYTYNIHMMWKEQNVQAEKLVTAIFLHGWMTDVQSGNNTISQTELEFRPEDLDLTAI